MGKSTWGRSRECELPGTAPMLRKFPGPASVLRSHNVGTREFENASCYNCYLCTTEAECESEHVTSGSIACPGWNAMWGSCGTYIRPEACSKTGALNQEDLIPR